MKRFRLFATLFAVSLSVILMAAEGGSARGGGRVGRSTGSRFGGGMMSRGFGSRGMSKMALVNIEQVQKELKITEDQLAKIKELQTAQREEMRSLYTGMGNWREMSEEERTKAREKLTKQREAMTKKAEKKLAACINKDQNKRLNEITLQLQGVDGMTSNYVVKGLKLTKDQITKIKAAIKARDEEMQKLMESLRGSFGRGRGRRGAEGGEASGERPERPNMEEIQKKRTAITKKCEDAIKAILTDAQKKTLETLKGKKFELDRNALRRTGGRTRGGSTGGEGRGGTRGEGRSTGGRRGRSGEAGGGN